MSDNSPYNIPEAPGRWRAITLALVMHVALFLFFWIGIRWQNETPLTVEAEIWDPNYKEAAPLPTPEPTPVVQPQPEPTPTPTPAPQPEPKPLPPKVIDEPKVAKPDIALQMEKEKKRREEQAKAEQAERQAQAEKQERADRLKAEKDKADREKKAQAQAQADKDKADREKKEKAEADKQKKLKEEKQKEDDAKKKADAEKQAADKKKQQQAAADSKAAEARRQEDLKRMMGQASSATSASGGTGTASKSQGPKGSPDYGNKLAAKIRSNTIFDVPGDLSGNPAVEYTVELFPDGTVRAVRNTKPSGVPGFDEAVRLAIMKSQPFPPDKDGKVPSSFSFTHKPKDQ